MFGKKRETEQRQCSECGIRTNDLYWDLASTPSVLLCLRCYRARDIEREQGKIKTRLEGLERRVARLNARVACSHSWRVVGMEIGRFDEGELIGPERTIIQEQCRQCGCVRRIDASDLTAAELAKRLATSRQRKGA